MVNKFCDTSLIKLCIQTRPCQTIFPCNAWASCGHRSAGRWGGWAEERPIGTERRDLRWKICRGQTGQTWGLSCSISEGRDLGKGGEGVGRWRSLPSDMWTQKRSRWDIWVGPVSWEWGLRCPWGFQEMSSRKRGWVIWILSLERERHGPSVCRWWWRLEGNMRLFGKVQSKDSGWDKIPRNLPTSQDYVLFLPVATARCQAN